MRTKTPTYVDVCKAVQSNTCNIDQDICDALVVPTTNLNEDGINCCICRYLTMQQHQIPEGTFRELSEQGDVFKDILQRVILPAQFKAATPSECKIIFMWIDGLKNAVSYVAFDRQCEPRLKIDHSFVYPGMTAGVCWSAQTSSPTTATSPILFLLFEQGGE